MNEETRVRLGAKQNAKGNIQLDITAEAPTVKEAEELLSSGIDSLKRVINEKELTMIN